MQRGASRLGIAACLWLALGGACARPPARCALCKMIVPAETHTVALIDGRPQTICDPRCALTSMEQTGRDIQLQRVTDIDTGVPLDPRRAIYVTGSDTAPDAHGMAMRTWPASRASLEWHRCLPSVLAFRTRDAALRHVQVHGGHLATYDTLGFRTPPRDATP